MFYVHIVYAPPFCSAITSIQLSNNLQQDRWDEREYSANNGWNFFVLINQDKASFVHKTKPRIPKNEPYYNHMEKPYWECSSGIFLRRVDILQLGNCLEKEIVLFMSLFDTQLFVLQTINDIFDSYYLVFVVISLIRGSWQALEVKCLRHLAYHWVSLLFPNF